MSDRYEGMCGDAYGNFYIDFTINGKTRELFVREDDIRNLAEAIDKTANELPTDGCAEIVDDDIRRDPEEYIIDWGLRETAHADK